MFSAVLVLYGSVFHRLGAETDAAQIPAFVLTLGTASKFELDDRSCLCCLAGLSVASKYRGCLDEKV